MAYQIPAIIRIAILVALTTMVHVYSTYVVHVSMATCTFLAVEAVV